jgi:hypothetical protein
MPLFRSKQSALTVITQPAVEELSKTTLDPDVEGLASSTSTMSFATALESAASARNQHDDDATLSRAETIRASTSGRVQRHSVDGSVGPRNSNRPASIEASASADGTAYDVDTRSASSMTSTVRDIGKRARRRSREEERAAQPALTTEPTSFDHAVSFQDIQGVGMLRTKTHRPLRWDWPRVPQRPPPHRSPRSSRSSAAAKSILPAKDNVVPPPLRFLRRRRSHAHHRQILTLSLVLSRHARPLQQLTDRPLRTVRRDKANPAPPTSMTWSFNNGPRRLRKGSRRRW